MRVMSVYSTTDTTRKHVSRGLYVVREVIGYELPDGDNAKARVVAIWYLSNGYAMEVSESDLISPSSATAYAMLSILSADLWVAKLQLLDK